MDKEPKNTYPLQDMIKTQATISTLTSIYSNKNPMKTIVLVLKQALRSQSTLHQRSPLTMKQIALLPAKTQ